MRNKNFIPLAIVLFLNTAHADSSFLQPTNTPAPVVETIPTNQPNAPQFYEYHNRMIVFMPFHQGYERIKPHAFYVGVEAYLIPLINEDKGWFFDGELRMGYNFFFNKRDHFTPVAGIGVIGTSLHHHHHRHKPAVVYGLTGFLYDHEFTKNYTMGCTAKFLFGGGVNKKHFDWGSPVIGYDISVPMTFRFGRHRHWDARIEPFNILLHGSEATVTYWGFRNSLGYRF